MPCKSFFFDTKSFEAVPQTTLEGARSPKVTFFVTQKEKYGSKCRQNIFGCNFENDTHVNVFAGCIAELGKCSKTPITAFCRDGGGGYPPLP